MPIFAGGRIRADRAHARAAYAEALSVYRQRVLQAFADVETSLSALGFLSVEKEAQDRALANARKAAALAETRYKAGFVSYLEVVDANREELQSERASVRLAGQRLNNSVLLIKSLGGGWKSNSAL
jgi:multidrug efflux system outer membrane protein